MPTVDQRAAAVSIDGLATTAMLLGAGISRRTIQRRVHQQSWARLLPNVVEVERHPWTWTRHARVALLAAPGGSAVSHLGAAHLHGLPVPVPREVDLLTARSMRWIEWRWPDTPIRLHTSVRTPEVDERRGLAVTPLVRTLQDLTSVVGRPLLHRVVRHVLGERLATPAAVLDGIRPRHAGCRVLRAVVEDEQAHADLPTESPLERRWVDILLRSDLPTFVTQYTMRTSDRAAWRLDLAWPEHLVDLEFDGREVHGDQAAAERDGSRSRSLARDGWFTKRLTWADAEQPRRTEVLAELRALLDAREHRGSGR